MTSRCEYTRGEWRCSKPAKQTVRVGGRDVAVACCTPHARKLSNASPPEVFMYDRRDMVQVPPEILGFEPADIEHEIDTEAAYTCSVLKKGGG